MTNNIKVLHQDLVIVKSIIDRYFLNKRTNKMSEMDKQLEKAQEILYKHLMYNGSLKGR
tara:strand:- start:84 stop:260 length:177 start_codon:yes stop_codon:yes gene_type:complete